ncbi:hypothetical protein D3C84_1284250 [compost metagenome]
MEKYIPITIDEQLTYLEAWRIQQQYQLSCHALHEEGSDIARVTTTFRYFIYIQSFFLNQSFQSIFDIHHYSP